MITDNCPGVVTDQTTGISGTGPFPLGTTVNTFTFTDLGGNVTTESFSVTVIDDNLSLTCLQVDDIYVETETTVEVDFIEPTFTGCGTLTQTIGDPSGTTLSEGDHPIEYTLYDYNGDVSETCSFTIHVASSINYFITTWETNNANETITIPTFAGETYNYEVDWNYNESNGFNSGGTYIETDELTSNQYATPGTYKIAIRGDFPRIYFNNGAVSRNNIIEINQWGNNPWASMDSAFAGCTNLEVKAPDTPDLSNAVSLYVMFSSCENLVGSEANWDWDVSTINNMVGVFFNATDFNGNISSWNTSNVTNMVSMFEGASSFNQPIVNWNTSSVLSMQNLFKDATNFNQNIGDWDLSSLLSNIYSMQGMFENVTLDTAIYDAILINWATDTSPLPNDGDDDIPTSIELHGGNSQYCLAENARDKLDTDYTWNIIDDGLRNVGCNNNAEDFFITTWDVDASTDLNIMIPTTGGGYAYQVDWNYDENIGFDEASDPRLHTGSADHDYSTQGQKK